MKILLFSHHFYPDFGGIESISEMLSDYFVGAGHEVRIITWTQNTGTRKLNYTVIRNPSIGTLWKNISWADILLENNPCLRMAWPNLFLRKPHVIGLQTWVRRLDGTIGTGNKLKRKWIHKADKVIACSEVIRKDSDEKALVIGNPYDADTFKRLDTIPKTEDFVFLGRLVSDKGAALAIKALGKLRKANNNNSRLTIIGEGPEWDSLHRLVKEEGLDGKVIFKGKMSGQPLVECLNAHKYLLVPSLWKEPFGIVALEGLVCGCLPVVADGGGLPDAVGRAGIVFERGNVDDLAAKMDTLDNGDLKPDDYLQYAPEQLAHHKKDYVAEQYLKVLQSVLSTYQPQSQF